MGAGDAFLRIQNLFFLNKETCCWAAVLNEKKKFHKICSHVFTIVAEKLRILKLMFDESSDDFVLMPYNHNRRKNIWYLHEWNFYESSENLLLLSYSYNCRKNIWHLQE